MIIKILDFLAKFSIFGVIIALAGMTIMTINLMKPKFNTQKVCYLPISWLEPKIIFKDKEKKIVKTKIVYKEIKKEPLTTKQKSKNLEDCKETYSFCKKDPGCHVQSCEELRYYNHGLLRSRI